MPVVVLESAGERVSQPHRLKVGLRRRGRASCRRAARATELVCSMKSCGFRYGREAFSRVGEPAPRLGEWGSVVGPQALLTPHLRADVLAVHGLLLVWELFGEPEFQVCRAWRLGHAARRSPFAVDRLDAPGME